MDFGTLLSVAQKNDQKQGSNSKACYQTKFTPPKKESKHTKSLSDNIKKFLAKKEEEERKKAQEEKKKKENLLAMRDHKAQSRINKHLKVCKAANKSVLEDAIDNQNTAVTITGPAQCDEDDYGYVSQEASAFYNKLMNKYSSLPPEKPLFKDDGKKTVKDIASTKDRVRQALKQQELEASLPHRRKRKHKDVETSDDKFIQENYDAQDDQERDREKDREREKEAEKEEKPRPKKKPMPPPMDFSELLKIAEKKQYEPIKIEPKPKPKEEPERLMTKRQMKEYAKEKDWREKKEQRSRNQESVRPAQSSSDNSSSSSSSKFKIPSVTKSSKPSSIKSASDISHEKTVSKTLPVITKKPSDRPPEKSSIVNRPPEKSSIVNRPPEKSSIVNRPPEKSSIVNRPPEKSNGVSRTPERSNGMNRPSEKSSIANRPAERNNGANRPTEKSSNSSRPTEKNNGMHSRPAERTNGIHKNSLPKVDPKASEKEAIARERRKLEEEKRQLEEMRRSIEEERKQLLMSKTKKVEDSRPSNSHSQKPTGSKVTSKEPVKSSSSLSKSAPSTSAQTSSVKSRPFPPADVKPRQFPPADVRPRQFPPPDVRKAKPNTSKLKINKRRIYDTDDEEYDSELDDFIDDGPDESEDYSKYISEIFGYDKSKYRHLDDEDDAAMESNFAQQLKEEFVSTKIGIMEDLEDMRQEALENKRKALLKKKRKM